MKKRIEGLHIGSAETPEEVLSQHLRSEAPMPTPDTREQEKREQYDVPHTAACVNWIVPGWCNCRPKPKETHHDD